MPAPERIAIVTTSYPASAGDPSGHFVAAEARELARAGHAVTVLTGGGGGGASSESEESPRVVRLWDGGATGWPGLVPRLKERPTRGLGLGVWGLAVRRELTRRGPFERVIGHWLVPSGFPTLFGAPLARAELELVVHGSDARLLAALPRAIGRKLLRSLARRARFRCVSHDLARLLRQIAEAPLTELSVAPLPIDVSAAPARAVARQELGLPAKACVIVIVSRLVAGKRVDDALAAAALLPHARVVVLGDGPELVRLRSAHPRAYFAGRVARRDALTWIAAADATLSASRLEGAPSAVREARALDVPVVACDAGDLREWAERDPELWVIE